MFFFVFFDSDLLGEFLGLSKGFVRFSSKVQVLERSDSYIGSGRKGMDPPSCLGFIIGTWHNKSLSRVTCCNYALKIIYSPFCSHVFCLTNEKTR